MSNDQLSWENILNNAAPESNTEAEKKPEAMLKPEKTDRQGTQKKSRAKTKEADASPAPAAEEQVLYSKKNWSKLEFKPKAETAASSEAVNTEPASKLAQSATPTAATSSAAETTSANSDKKPATAAARSVSSSASANDLDAALGNEDEETSPAAPEPQVISVSELNRHIRDILEGRFPLVWLKGEISNFKAHTSGHFYFSLKDAKAQINAVMFRGFNGQLRFRPEDGMEVLVRGKVTVYEPRGNYQFFCEMMEPVGAGALQKAYEQLKSKLQREGLFDQARKRPLPSLPRHIAIVTSPTGAAIRDMLNVLGRRFKGARITLVPCKVQGDQAPSEIVNAIKLANRLTDVDVMIVGRGGGSIEDLWAFNDEGVARAIAGSKVPVISAVGHEVDFTIADFVADLRAPTPSAAAELVVKNAADIVQRLQSIERSLKLAVLRLLANGRQSVTAVARRLVDPQRRIQDAAMRCDELLQRLDASAQRALETRRMHVIPLETRLKTAVRNLMVRKRELLARNGAVLDSLSPLKVLDRGYSMVTGPDGSVKTDATSLNPGEVIEVRMCKGAIEAQVTKVIKKA
jgi:exodeoxyribonuclease VII large subunit